MPGFYAIQILNGQGFPKTNVDLWDEWGKIPLFIGDSALPKFSFQTVTVMMNGKDITI